MFAAGAAGQATPEDAAQQAARQAKRYSTGCRSSVNRRAALKAARRRAWNRAT
jgi:hypothetical protein